MVLPNQIAIIAAGSAFLIALTSGTLLTSFMCRWSRRWGALDRPDGSLKRHSREVATLGGIPLFMAAMTGIAVLALIGYGRNDTLKWLNWNWSWLGLFVAALIVLLIGVCDDLRGVLPRTKLISQTLAATIMVGSGILIQRCGFLGVFEIPCHLLAVPFTIFWLVGSCNAFNFIDGMDGLASGIGLVAVLALAGMGFAVQAYTPAILALALAGALAAVLLFNIKPACIFLGDSGSQVVGLMVGVLAIKINTINGVFMLPTAGLILSLPVIDALLAILRRYSNAESIARGDHQHIHHCLRRRGLSINRTTMTLWAVTIINAAAAVVCRYATGVSVAVVALAFVIFQLCLFAQLGCLDWHMLWQRLSGRKYWNTAYDVRARLGAADLEALWERMKPLFEQMRLDRAILTLEGVSEDGQPNLRTYRWVRSDEMIAELLRSRWTKRFALGPDQSQVAVLQLEADRRLRRDEQRIDWLLQQITHNMRQTSHHKTSLQPTGPDTEKSHA